MTRAQSIHTLTNIEKYLDRFKRPLHDKLVDTLRHEMPQWRGNLWKLTRRYEEWLRVNLIVELDEISAKEHKHFFGTLMKAHACRDRYLECRPVGRTDQQDHRRDAETGGQLYP